MQFCSIASGSSGNCIWISSDSTGILIDAGISGKRIEEGLRGIGHSMEDVRAVLMTHEHIDHVRGIGVLARRHGIPVYATAGSCGALLEMTAVGKIPDGILHTIEKDDPFSIGDLSVRAFSVSHDAADPCGFRIVCGEKSAAVATDLGTYGEDTIAAISGLDVLLVESNHDLRMLETGRYPYYLKRRIMGEKGHLSNTDCGRLLNHVLHDGLREIFLGHLSQENNYEPLAYETVCQEITEGECPYTADDFPIRIAHRDRPSDFVEF